MYDESYCFNDSCNDERNIQIIPVELKQKLLAQSSSFLPNDHQCSKLCDSQHHWVGLRENLQETMVFTIKYGGFL